MRSGRWWLLAACLVGIGLLGSFVMWRMVVRAEHREMIQRVDQMADDQRQTVADLSLVIEDLEREAAQIDTTDDRGDDLQAAYRDEIDRAEVLRSEQRAALDTLQSWLDRAEVWSEGTGWLFSVDGPPALRQP